MNFIYDKDIPDAILAEIKRNLEPWGWMVPGWCERIFVGYSVNSDEGGASACVTVEYAYRWARITFFPSFLVQADPLEDALHEVIHISLAPLTNYARDAIKRLVPVDEAPKFRDTLLEEIKERVESATEDIARRVFMRDQSPHPVTAGHESSRSNGKYSDAEN